MSQEPSNKKATDGRPSLGAAGDPTAGSRPSASEDSDRDLSEVLEVAANALRESLGELDDTEQGIEQIGDLIGAAESAKAKPAATPPPKPGEPKSGKRTQAGEQAAPGLSVEELRQAIEEIESTLEDSLTAESLHSNEEELSILLQALPAADTTELTEAVLEKTVYVLERLPLHMIQGIVQGAMREYLEVLDPEQLDHCFPILSFVLRLGNRPFHEQLLDASRQATAKGRLALWPHMVNELLTIADSNRDAMADCWAMVDELPPALLAEATQRVLRLSALEYGSMGQTGFNAHRIASFRLYAGLLKTNLADAIGAEVLNALRQTPLEVGGARHALNALDRYRSEYAPFLNKLLLDAKRDVVSNDLCQHAAELLVPALARLDVERRKEPWVPEAILWLGTKSFPPSVEILKAIVSQRKGLIRMWPRDCRKEAKRALARIKSSRGPNEE